MFCFCLISNMNFSKQKKFTILERMLLLIEVSDEFHMDGGIENQGHQYVLFYMSGITNIQNYCIAQIVWQFDSKLV